VVLLHIFRQRPITRKPILYQFAAHGVIERLLFHDCLSRTHMSPPTASETNLPTGANRPPRITSEWRTADSCGLRRRSALGGFVAHIHHACGSDVIKHTRWPARPTAPHAFDTTV